VKKMSALRVDQLRAIEKQQQSAEAAGAPAQDPFSENVYDVVLLDYIMCVAIPLPTPTPTPMPTPAAFVCIVAFRMSLTRCFDTHFPPRPVMDGPTAAVEMRKLGYNGIIVGVTGNALANDVDHFVKHGANCVLTKPLDMVELNTAIKTFAGTLQ
jgi:CheY-like chemotaxis protein